MLNEITLQDEDPNHWIYSSTNNNAYYINSDDNKNYVVRLSIF